MKILRKVVILVLVCLLPICVATACAPSKCTITFVQEGQVNIVKTVEKGSDLTDIPSPTPVADSEVVWDRTDFTNIQENITVNAVITPMYKVTFVQDGQANVVKTVKKGATLTDIPVPASVVGHDVVWNVTDFTNVQNNMTVNAVVTAKTFTITYEISSIADNNGVTLPQLTQTVTYGQAFTLFDLPTFVEDGVEYVLTAWLKDGEKFVSGTWTLLDDITLKMGHFEPVDVPEWI